MVAEMPRPRAAGCTRACFNGAATNWSRKSCGDMSIEHSSRMLQWGRDQLVAEMQLFDDLLDVIVKASMGPRPIGRGNGRQTGRRQRATARFNGAATNWSRKWEIIGLFALAGDASMGPRPIGRGNPFCCGQLMWRGICFNGAATNWSRKLRLTGWYTRSRWKASMGPRPIGRGNLICHHEKR